MLPFLAGLWDELAKLQGKERSLNGLLSRNAAAEASDGEEEDGDVDMAGDDAQLARAGFSMPVSDAHCARRARVCPTPGSSAD